MANNDNKKKPFGQRAKGFALKTVFCAAAAGSVGGTGYYYSHATREDVPATVTSTDGGTVIADKGAFTNQPPAIPEVRQEDRAAPEACAMEANPDEMVQKTPKLARDLAILANLPLTGKPVYDIVTNPANDIKACLYPVPVGYVHLRDTYGDHRLDIARTAPSNTYFHENFHAAQDVSGKILRTYELTIRDFVISDLLKEATAVAYELATEQEAENNHLGLSDSTDGTTTASDHSQNREAFNAAYNAALKQYANMDAETREAKAFEAGGKAVVRRLMNQEDPNWRNNYSEQARKNVNNNLQFFNDDGREKKPGYQDLRRDVYTKLGKASSKINFIPEEYLGTDADSVLAKTFRDWGISVTKVSAATPRNFPRFG